MNERIASGLLAWVFTRQAAMALAASSAANLLLLIPTLVTLQIYDRVLSSRHTETLLMLLLAAGFALLSWSMVEAARVHWFSVRGAEWEQETADTLAPYILDAPNGMAQSLSAQIWRDLAVCRAFIAGPALLAISDAPWSLVYLLVITAFHPLLGFIALLGITVLIALAWLTEWRLRGPTESSEQVQEQSRRRAGEVAAFNEVMRAHGQQAQVSTALQAATRVAADARLGVELAGHSFKTWGKLIRQVLQFAMLAAGAWLVLRGQTTGGVMIAGSILLGKTLMPLEVLIGSWKHLLETRKAATRISVALAAQNRLAQQRPETALPACRGQLRAANLGVKLSPAEPAIIHGISFELPAGSVLAVVGDSGSGKSMLARVLAGIQAPSHGEITLDSAALQQYDAQVRGEFTGYLPQDVLLHSGTIAHNISRQWHPSESLSQAQSDAVIHAAQLAGVHELIVSLPKGYDTRLGTEPGAMPLSGGQRQRIALARALYATPTTGQPAPSLIVLDEPDSQLDAHGNAALQRSLQALRQHGATVVVVTHRPELLNLATHVLMLRRGTVERFGPSREVYQWLAQRKASAAALNDGRAPASEERQLKSA
ncbi:MAG: ATP-binding cassette domain-containing protein [Proteobacteria bacterium]|nr:ATP-binding cassette domain-containing protein [Pseudomonadota bacterium]